MVRVTGSYGAQPGSHRVMKSTQTLVHPVGHGLAGFRAEAGLELVQAGRAEHERDLHPVAGSESLVAARIRMVEAVHPGQGASAGRVPGLSHPDRGHRKNQSVITAASRSPGLASGWAAR